MTVWLDFHARTGQRGEFVQQGPHMLLGPAGALALSPGLFSAVGPDGQPLDGDAWAAWSEHPEIKQRLADGSLRIVSDDLREYAGPGQLHDLIERTTDREAIAHLRAREMAKPEGFGAGRRDADVIQLLDRAQRLSRSPISTAGFEPIAKPIAKTGGKSR